MDRLNRRCLTNSKYVASKLSDFYTDGRADRILQGARPEDEESPDLEPAGSRLP